MPNVKVFIERGNISKKIDANSIEGIIKKFNINHETVLIVLNNTLTTRKARLKNGDEVKFLSVISGG